MANTARQLTDPNSRIDYGHVSYFDGIGAFSGFLRFRLDDTIPAVSPFGGTPNVQLRWLVTLGNASYAPWQLYYYVNGGAPVLRMGYDNGAGINGAFGSTLDPFSALGAGWHDLEWSWSGLTNTMTCHVDTTAFVMTKLGGSNLSGMVVAGDCTLTIGNPPTNDLGSGGDPTAVAWKGMEVSDLAFRTGVFTSGERSALLAAPSQVSVDPASLLDAGMVRGVTPETGVVPNTTSPNSSTAHGSINLATIVAGPTLGPGFACAVGFTPNSTSIHAGATVAVALSWLWQLPAGSSTTFTLPTLAGATFSPTSLTLGTSPTDSQTTSLAISPGATVQPYSGPITNVAGLPTTPLSYSVFTPTAQVSSASVDPSGNILIIHATTTGGSPTPTAITAVADGAVLTVNGKDYPLNGNWVPYGIRPGSSNQGIDFAWFPVNVQDKQVVDETDVGCTLGGGTWTAVTPNQATNGNFLWWLDQIHTSPDVGATATFTFAVRGGKQYRIQTPHTFRDPNAEWTDATTAARTTATDGTTTAHADRDQTADTTDDWVDVGYHWTDLLVFNTAPTATTLTVTVTNQAGAGKLYVDAIRIELVQSATWILGSLRTGSPIMPPGATATLTGPDNMVTTAAGLTGPVTALAVTLLADDGGGDPTKAFLPFDPTAVRTMKVGYDLGPPSQTIGISRPFSNLVYSSTKWFGCDLDPVTGSVTRVAAGQFALNAITSNGFTSGYDVRGVATAIEGFYRVIYDDDVAGATTFVFNDWESAGLSFAYTNLAGDTAHSGGTHHDVLVQIGRNSGLPPINGIGYAIKIMAGGSDARWSAGLNLVIYGPEITQMFGSTTGMDNPTWNRLANPAAIARMGNTGYGSMRAMDFLGENLAVSNVVHFSDWPTNKVCEASVLRRSATIVSVDPVDLTVADADKALAYFGKVASDAVIPPNHSLVAVVKVRTTGSLAAIGLKSGMLVSFATPGDVFFWPANDIAGVGFMQLLANPWIIPIDGSDTDVLLAMFQNNYPVEQNPNPGKPVTLALGASHAPTGGNVWTMDADIHDQGATPMNLVQLCNDLGVDAYINVPHTITDISNPAAITSQACQDLGAWCGAHVRVGGKVRLAWSNEFPWTGTYTQSQWGNAVANKLGLGVRDFYARNMAAVHTAFMTGWTGAGRDPADFRRVMEGQFGNPGVAEGSLQSAQDNGFHFDELAIAPYIDNNPFDAPLAVTSDRPDIEDLLDYSGLVSVQWMVAGMTGVEDLFKAHLDKCVAHGFPDVYMITYEGGLQQYIRGTQLDSKTFAARVGFPAQHPRSYRWNLAWLQTLEQKCHVKFYHRYGYDVYGQMNFGTCWQDYYSNYDVLGTGAASEGANPGRMITNAGGVAVGRTSQLGGAMRAFAALTVVGGMAFRGSGSAAFAGSTPAPASAAFRGVGTATFAGTALAGSFTFHHPRDSVSGVNAPTVTVARSAGAATITVDNAALLGAGYPLIVSPVRPTLGTTGLTILEIATAPAGNVLTVAGTVDGTTDVALQVGDKLEMRPVAKHVDEVQAACNTLLARVAALEVRVTALGG